MIQNIKDALFQKVDGRSKRSGLARDCFNDNGALRQPILGQPARLRQHWLIGNWFYDNRLVDNWFLGHWFLQQWVHNWTTECSGAGRFALGVSETRSGQP